MNELLRGDELELALVASKLLTLPLTPDAHRHLIDRAADRGCWFYF